MDPVVQLRNIDFAYGTGRRILHIPDFSMSQGEHVFLHGPSGSGKTSLLTLLTGILSPQAGEVWVLGTALSQLGPRQRDRFRGQHLGYIFQMFNLIPYLNVEENIMLPLAMNRQRKMAVTDPESELEELLAELGISELRQQNVQRLSVGQQQRVAVARSLLGGPRLIVADEPTSALDFDSREAFLKLLFQAASRHQSTILLVSHDHSLAGLFPRQVAMGDINSVSLGGP